MKKLILYLLSVLSISLATSCNLLQEIIDHDDSNTDEKFNGNYAFVEDYIENLDAVLSPDGYVCLFGVDTSDEIDGEYNKIFYITKADYKTGEITSADEICVVVDSVGIPNIISMENYNIYISNITNSTFDCIIVEEGKENIELKNLSLPKQESYSIKGATRSIASSDAIPIYGLDNLIDDIGKAQAMQAMITAATNTEKWSAGIGAIGTVLGGEAGLTLGGISDALTGSLRNSYLALAGYMWSENQKFILNHIGPWHISIESVEQTGRNTCVVGYTIDGIWDDCEGKPRVYLNCQNSDKNKHTGKVEQALELGYAVNGYREVEIKNLKAGYYLIEMRLYDECHKVTNLSIRTYPPILLQMADLELSKYEIEENPLYENGTVNFKMNIFLKGNEDGLDDVQQFGYYIKYANAIDYKEVKNLSSIFESTPLTYDLDIEREGFFEENINYTTFEARAVDYHIGAYAVVDGKIMTYDEQEMELIYSEHPEVETGEYVSVSPIKVNVKSEFKNCLFWNAIRGIEYVAESESNPKSLVLGANMEDGEHQFPLEDLKPNTTYQYRAFYEVNGIREYGEPMEFKTEPLNLTLDSIFYNDDYYYYTKDNNGYVAYNLTAKISGNTDVLEEFQSCGIYIWDSQKNESRIWYEGLSGAYNNTSINMFIGVNELNFDKRDDSRYYAESTKYYFGVYVQFNDGSYYMSEPVQCNFVYDRKPTYKYTSVGPISVSVTGSDVDENGETITYYTARHDLSIAIDGAFWIDTVQARLSGYNWTYPNTGTTFDESWKPSGDYSYDTSAGLNNYNSRSSMSVTIWTVITTKSGETLSSNSLVYGGSPENPTVSIGGTRSSSSMSTPRLLIGNNVNSGKGGSINLVPENKTLKKCDITEIDDLKILYK